MAVPKTIRAEYERALAAEKALSDRISKLEPVTPPPPPPTGYTVAPGEAIAPLLAAGHRSFLLTSGTHRLSLGSSETSYRDVTILAKPGHSPVIDGAGLDPHFVYLGPQSGTWIIGVPLRNFFPTGSGVIGIGDGCRLETVKGFSLVGKGGAASNQDHGVYFHGTGTGKLIEPDITAFPGSALQTYRGSPVVEVQGGKLHGLYVGVFHYNGKLTATGVDIRGTGPSDLKHQDPATFTLTNCTGRQSDGKPIVTDDT